MSLLLISLLGIAGLACSAFFSGAETGFYKVSRLRLKLDAMEGDRVAAWLFTLVNRPSIFVATVLVGNNVANYALSLTVVLATTRFLGPGESIVREVVSTLLAAPLLFLYGELFPKQLFLQTPDRLLRSATPILVVATILFLPFSLMLWLLNMVLSRLVGRSHEQIKLTLARTELSQTFRVGAMAGVLHPTQRELAERVLTTSPESAERVRRWGITAAAFPIVTTTMTPAQAVAVLGAHASSVVPVYAVVRDGDVATLAAAGRIKPRGYTTRTELLLAVRGDDSFTEAHTQHATTPLFAVHPCIDIRDDVSPLAALASLETAGTAIGCLVDASGSMQGFIVAEEIRRRLV